MEPKSKRGSDFPSARSLTQEPLRSLIPRGLRSDDQVMIWLAGYREGERVGSEEAWHRAQNMRPERAAPPPAARPARAALDPQAFTDRGAPRAPAQLAPPEEVAGEDPDDDEEPVAKGPSGVFPLDFETDFLKYYEDRSTDAARARQIVLTVLQTLVQPDRNVMPPTSVGTICWRALINAGIARGVGSDGFIDHNLGSSSSLGDGAASESANRMGMSEEATAAGLTT